jgi:hypothetical protein
MLLLQVVDPFEKKLVALMCELLLGFTRPDTYFSGLEEGEFDTKDPHCLSHLGPEFTHHISRPLFALTVLGFYFMECGLELPEYCIDAFGVEVDILLKATMRSRLVEQISTALNRELFDGNGTILAVEDHKSVAAVHGFLQVSARLLKSLLNALGDPQKTDACVFFRTSSTTARFKPMSSASTFSRKPSSCLTLFCRT